jgi:hypothetical protein
MFMKKCRQIEKLMQLADAEESSTSTHLAGEQADF